MSVEPLCAYYVTSGRFCGVLREQGFVHQSHHAGNDRRIRKIKYIPLERPGGCAEVKQGEIHDGIVYQAIDRVADRPPDNQAKRQARQQRPGAHQPGQEEHHGGHLEAKQYPLPQWPRLLEQAVADAPVPGEHQVEERRDPYPVAFPEAETVQQIFGFAIRRICEESSFWFRRVQTGLVQNYAMLMLFGIFAFVSIYLFMR